MTTTTKSNQSSLATTVEDKPKNPIGPTYRDAHLTMDFAKHRIWAGNREVNLTITEWLTLQFLVAAHGLVIEYADLIRLRYPACYEIDRGLKKLVMGHALNLRQKLGWSTSGPLVTVQGRGYVYDPEWRTPEE